MIDIIRLNREWIMSVSSEPGVDPLLAEKVIRALLLLEGLAKEKIDFVFKGGTALMLHYNSAKRLSIDIDIIIPDKALELKDIFDTIVEVQGFSRWEMHNRAVVNEIEKAHYKFSYEPFHRSAKSEEHILLDILYEDIHYSRVIKLPVSSPFVPTSGQPIYVDVPSVEDLLATS